MHILKSFYIIHERQRRKIQQREGGEAEFEIPVAGLVVKGMHPQPAAESTAEGGHGEKPLFRHTPPAAPRLPFVMPHHYKQHKADNAEINYQIFEHFRQTPLLHQAQFAEVPAGIAVVLDEIAA